MTSIPPNLVCIGFRGRAVSPPCAWRAARDGCAAAVAVAEKSRQPPASDLLADTFHGHRLELDVAGNRAVSVARVVERAPEPITLDLSFFARRGLRTPHVVNDSS